MSSEHFETEYPKIVRDKIPEIITENSGSEAEIVTLIDDDEYLQYLLKKASEEGRELSSATTDKEIVEEIADLRELMDAILALKGISKAHVRAVQDEKRAKRGGFAKRLLMMKKV